MARNRCAVRFVEQAWLAHVKESARVQVDRPLRGDDNKIRLADAEVVPPVTKQALLVQLEW